MTLFQRKGSTSRAFRDEFGGDFVRDYMAGLDSDEVANAMDAVNGDPVVIGERSFDVSAQIYNRRWAAKMREIAAQVILQMPTLPTVDASAIAKATADLTAKRVLEALDAAGIPTESVSADEIAKAVAAELAPRFDAIDDELGITVEPVPGPDRDATPTVGIDIAWPQMADSHPDNEPFPYATARAEGIGFIGVKAAGYNIGELYVADGYHEHIDGALAAGYDTDIFHYYVPGNASAGENPKTPEAQAEFFVNSLYGYKPGQVLALDNEPLDSNATFWKQDNVVRWINRVIAKTNISPDRIWVYFPAFLTRANTPWDKVEALGVKAWWASYGEEPFTTGRVPTHDPDLQGSLSDWDIHQYTNSLSVADRSVDGNYSRASLRELFG